MNHQRTQSTWVVGEKIYAGYFQVVGHDPFSFDHVNEDKEYEVKLELVELTVHHVGRIAQHSPINPGDPTNFFILKDPEGNIWSNKPAGAMGEARGHTSFFTCEKKDHDLGLLTSLLDELTKYNHHFASLSRASGDYRASLYRKTYYNLIVAMEKKWPHLRVVELRWGGWDDAKKYFHVLVDKDQRSEVKLSAEVVHFLKSEAFYRRPPTPEETT